MGEELKYWIWLTLVTNIGTELPSTLIKYFGSPKDVYEADAEALAEVPKISREAVARLSDKELSRAQRIIKYCEDNSICIMTAADSFFPQRFRILHNPPIVLYYLGAFCDIDNSCTVAVVGTREASDYGINATKRIAYDLAKNGAVIVSGLALGIDRVAHTAALVAGGFTIGFLGCGIDRFYPDENKELIEEVAAKGLVITEYPPGTPPNGSNFPVRNRLICAISLATAVMEAPAQSGALITAEYALRQESKELFVLPGSIFSRRSSGTNHLLRLGAKPLIEAEDILCLYRRDYKDKLLPVPQEEKNAPKKKRNKNKVFKGLRRAVDSQENGSLTAPPEFDGDAFERETVSISKESYDELSEPEKILLEYIGEGEADIDALISDEMSVSQVMRAVTRLELSGLITALPGGKYRAAYEIKE